ncbi:hypothetical protein HYC85_007820 [Camellia sinensis]|uniref:Piezo-type mechanosensitive ion channel homolog domain-containing protein n=1 Tax=Camellia sinensis TaxID=4442 RepID=A0A7J7HSF7_CAMSI|nr:hypothetical protein HYC85_007820 [Camellia sinensis]
MISMKYKYFFISTMINNFITTVGILINASAYGEIHAHIDDAKGPLCHVDTFVSFNSLVFMILHNCYFLVSRFPLLLLLAAGFPDKVNSEEPEVMIVATIAWGLCKSSRAIVLTLIFSIALKPGFIHAVYSKLNSFYTFPLIVSIGYGQCTTKTFSYEDKDGISLKCQKKDECTYCCQFLINITVVFFMIYLLSHTISRRIRQYLILLCEAHFVLKYILQLNLISKALEEKGSLALEIISQLGLLDHASSGDFVKIAGLACFCSVYNHGSDMLFSYSTIVQHTPFPPIGWSILKAGLNKSVLLSVYTPSSREREPTNSFNGIIVSKAEYIPGDFCDSNYFLNCYKLEIVSLFVVIARYFISDSCRSHHHHCCIVTPLEDFLLHYLFQFVNSCLTHNNFIQHIQNLTMPLLEKIKCEICLYHHHLSFAIKASTSIMKHHY